MRASQLSLGDDSGDTPLASSDTCSPLQTPLQALSSGVACISLEDASHVQQEGALLASTLTDMELEATRPDSPAPAQPSPDAPDEDPHGLARLRNRSTHSLLPSRASRFLIAAADRASDSPVESPSPRHLTRLGRRDAFQAFPEVLWVMILQLLGGRDLQAVLCVSKAAWRLGQDACLWQALVSKKHQHTRLC